MLRGRRKVDDSGRREIDMFRMLRWLTHSSTAAWYQFADRVQGLDSVIHHGVLVRWALFSSCRQSSISHLRVPVNIEGTIVIGLSKPRPPMRAFHFMTYNHTRPRAYLELGISLTKSRSRTKGIKDGSYPYWNRWIEHRV